MKARVSLLVFPPVDLTQAKVVAVSGSDIIKNHSAKNRW